MRVRIGPRTGDSSSASPGVPARRAGLTIVELLVVLSVIAVLSGVLLPAIQQVRETSRNLQCGQHLKQLGTALHAYHDSWRALPPGLRCDASRTTAFGWAATLLPHLEQTPLHNAIDFHSAVATPGNLAIATARIELFTCPSDNAPETFELFAEADHEFAAISPLTTSTEPVLARLPSASYLGVFGTPDPDDVRGPSGDGVFMADRSVRFAQVTDGLSNVYLVGERTARKLPATWFGIALDGEDAAGRLLGNAWLGPNREDADECEFDSRHHGHVNFLWGDGRVTSVQDGIDPAIYRQSATRD
ncbi:MAG: DUF1559 domain-containing protein [Planctomycetaceae bacterium]